VSLPGADAAVRARHQQRVEELCGAAVRALSGDPALHFRGGRLHRGQAPYPARAPHLRPSLDTDDLGSFRGAADGLALRRLHSDPDLHARLAPEPGPARLVHDLLEQLRAEALAPRRMTGVVANLRHRHETWSAAFHASGLTETPSGLLLYTVAQVARARVTGEPVVEATEDLLEGTRLALAPVIGPDLAALRRLRHDQAGYAVHALRIAAHVASLLERYVAEADGAPPQPLRDTFSLLVDGDDEDTPPAARTGAGHDGDGEASGYRVFTREFDTEREAAALVRPARLRELRERLDELVTRTPVNRHRLARQLRAALSEPADAGWERGREHGLVDGRVLARLVTSPTERRLFQRPHREPHADALVTFLVDCSGSMRGHREAVATALDLLVRALDQAEVSTEVLGFTTGGWNGGRALRAWTRAGRPPAPGRLNELSHLVFKDADTSWRRARAGLAAMLTEHLYREGVDGEAVAWACARMRARPQSRRLLVVVSDGSPMDTATVRVNGPDYLDAHLREVVRREEQHGAVLVHGLGLGLDLGSFYPRSQALDLRHGIGNEVLADVVRLLSRPGRR